MSLQIPILKCQWVKHPQGVEIDDYGFAIIDQKNVGHKDVKKYIVVPGKQRVVGVDVVEDEEEYNQCDEVPFFVDTKG
jgi:hypothetical protein